jgi:acyl-CoA reductase-like NAD-dependent aldehyde dehydrogenase/uncharacterized protein (DUF2141 family)
VNNLSAEQRMTRARAAQLAWAMEPVDDRCAYLKRLRRDIARQCDAISTVIARDTNKPLLDALSGDVLVTLEQIRYYERHAAKILRPRRNRKPLFMLSGTQFETHLEPHGVALICGPSNYPFQLSVIPLITALAAGNAVILKCSERAPETAALIADLLAGTGLPQDVVQVVQGGPEVAESLLDAGPDFVFFTGSSHHGQLVAQRAAKQLIPALLELGGKDATLVFEDCHLDRAVEGIVYGAFSNSGRVCVAVKRVYVQASIFDEFLSKLKNRIAELHVGNDPDSDLCPLPPSALPSHVKDVRDAISRGAKLCFPSENALAGGPVILSDVPADARLMVEESFGPALVVAAFKDETDAVELANASPFALSSSVWTRDHQRARRVAALMSAGSCAVNDVTRVIANPYAPFGGNGKSGYGRYHGAEGLQSFSRTKTIMYSSDRKAREINWFPFTNQTRTRLSKLIQLRHGMSGVFSRMSRVLPFAFLALLLPLVPVGQTPDTVRLTVDVHLTKEARGQLAYLIFTSPAGFPGNKEKAAHHGFLPIPLHAGEMKFQLDMPPGAYAVTVYEDLNGNRSLDRNIFGIPREPVGASNNPKGRFGPPDFSECTFHLGDSAETITINLVKGI